MCTFVAISGAKIIHFELLCNFLHQKMRKNIVFPPKREESKRNAHMNEQITERVNEYLRIKNIKKVEVAKVIGWGQAKLISQLNGTRGISVELLSALFEHYPDLSKDYVFSGTGKPVLDANEMKTVNEQMDELKIQLREKDAQIKVLKSLIK